jgi:hypothetical protein
VELRGIEDANREDKTEPFSRADEIALDVGTVGTVPNIPPSGQAESLQATDVSLRAQLARLLGVPVDRVDLEALRALLGSAKSPPWRG